MMTESEFLRLLPYLLGGMFASGVLLFLLSLHQIRRRRTGAYWRLRRRAGERGARLFLLSVGLMVGSVALTLVSGLVVLAIRPGSDGLIRGPDDLYGIVLPSEPEQTATRAALLTDEPRAQETLTPSLLPPTETPLPRATLTLLPPTETPAPALETRAPTATQTLVAPVETLANISTNTPLPPTETPLPSHTSTLAATPAPVETLDPNFRLRLQAASASLVEDLETSPIREFSSGTRRIYFYISFEHMSDGAEWSRVLYRDDVPIQADTQLWRLGASGDSYFYIENALGYQPGYYEMRLYVAGQEASRYPFLVSES